MKPGDVEHLGNSGAKYVLNFGTNAMCRLEEHTKQYHGDVIDRLSEPKAPIELARAWVWAAMVDRTNLTIERAGEILDDIGGPYELLLAFRLVTIKRDILRDRPPVTLPVTEAKPS